MDTSTRLWFFSRTISFVSKAFDFIKDPKPLIRFILATSFASNEEMGYDLTVERVKNDAKVWVYDYEVADEDGKSTWYRTVDCLWTHRSGRISGRGNRVWEVQELDENRNPAMQKGKPKSTCVLKDYWVNCDAIRESAKRNEIIDRALAKNPGLQRRDIEKHFMTILHDIYVKCHDGNGALVDDTSEVQLRGWLLPEEYSEFLLEMPTNNEYTKPQIRNGARSLTTGASGSTLSTQSSSQHDQPSAPTNPSRIVPANRVDGPRRHCRTIFRELGTRLDELTDQRAFIQSLIDALQGLKFLYDAEYLHCDMSDGNLLWCYDSDHDLMICKTLDLEYARPHLQSNEENYRPHNHRTGTPAFMALEVQANHYLFRSERSVAESDSEEEGDKQMESDGSAPEESSGVLVAVPFLHNYLHDVEGIWWIMVYHLLSTSPNDPQRELSNIEREERIHTTRVVFPPSPSGSSDRSYFLTVPDRYCAVREKLPSEYQDLGKALDKVRVLLKHSYSSLENPSLARVIVHENYRGLHDKFIARFKKMKKHAVSSVIKLANIEEVLQVPKAVEGALEEGKIEHPR
ncbi:hypothetical protein AAF712_007736 [Marasmius tenuissimus]|uniref:Fungal-type protein kinase domain-containing protein n=1 Tax=Marasmius tenuissimus TaxID=585030 RepID=A0ABR2ZVA0_9AGAR